VHEHKNQIKTILHTNLFLATPCSGKMLDCGVLGPRIEAHCSLVFITTTTAIYSVGHGVCTPTAVPRSTQPSTFRGTVKWVLVNARVKSGVSPLPTLCDPIWQVISRAH